MAYLMPHYTASDPATTMRPSSTSLFTIDSEDRFTSYEQSREATNAGTNTTPYDFQITRSESLMNGFASRIAVTEIVFPWAIPNINAKTAEVLVGYQVQGQPATVPAPILLLPGFYTPGQIAASIQAIVRTLDPTLSGFVFTYGANSNPVFTYESTTTTTVQFLPLPYNSPTYRYPNTTKQLFDLLGFTGTNSLLSLGGNGNYTLAQCFRYVDIVSPTLVYNQANRDTMSQVVARNALCRIYLGDGGAGGQSTVSPADATFSPPGCAPMIIYRNFTVPKYIQWMGNQPIPGTLRFTIYDDTGAPLAEALDGLLEGEYLDWSMTMLISEN